MCTTEGVPIILKELLSTDAGGFIIAFMLIKLINNIILLFCMKEFPYKILILTANIGKFGETDGVVTTYQNLIKELDKLEIDTDVITYGPKDESEKKGTVTIFTHKSLIPFKIDPKRQFDFLISLGRSVKIANLRDYDIIISGTPDPLGFIGLNLAKKNKIPFLTFYHTALDDYVGTRVKKVGINLSKDFTTSFYKLYSKNIKNFNTKKYYKENKKRIKRDVKILNKNLKNISTKMGKFAGKNMIRWLKNYFNKSNLILAPSNHTKKFVESIFKPKVSILARGVDIGKFNPKFRKKENKKPKALYVGRVSPEKNLKLLVKIFSKIKNIDLEIVGDGAYLKEMKKELPNAIYKGSLSGKELSKAYANADFFVFPSKFDTFGNVVQEAFASGIPAIVTDKKGPKDIVKHNSTGFIAKDDKEFEKYVLKLVKEEKLRKKMGKAAREYAKQHTWKDITLKLLDYCKELIEK